MRYEPTHPWYKNMGGLWEPGHGLGRKVPETLSILPRFRQTKLTLMVPPLFKVNKRLNLPVQYIPKYDQGAEGACVGFALSWAMSILNRRFYAARKLYLEAQLIDPWTDTPPQEGTSVEAGAKVLMDQGHWRFARGVTFPLAAFEGIESFSQARTVDEVRQAIQLDIPAIFGINWYENFDRPEWIKCKDGKMRWVIGGDRNNLGKVRGGHAICCYGARDDISMVSLVNSWGVNYPIVNMPYGTLERLIEEDGEVIIPVDRK